MSPKPVTNIDQALIEKILGRKLTAAQKSNANSVISALNTYGSKFGLDQPHREAQFLPQILHESGSFVYDREIWGPTAAQKKYDTRTDLGNTKAVDGDGKLRAGKGPIQVTGGSNEKQYTKWARATIDPKAPDFYAKPDLINTDPWEGLSAIWYWDSRGLNRYADQGDVETITVKINGGKNGLADRLNWYGRTALVMLGYGPTDVSKFQKDAKIDVDGDVGPRTRSALHAALLALTSSKKQSDDVQIAPVVDMKEVEVEKKVAVEVPVPVKTKNLDKPWYMDLLGQKELATTVAIPGVSALGGVPWQNVAIIAVLCLVGGAAFYIIRRKDAAKQNAQVEAIHADAAEARASI